MYKCAPQIGRVLAQFHGDVLDWVDEILLVDNRSPDDTVDAARKALETFDGPRVTLKKNDSNYGLGGSHKVAFDHAIKNGFDYLVVLHGDDQGAIADLIPCLEQGQHLETDTLLGARFMKGSRLQGYSSFRIFGNEVFNRIFSIVAGKRIYDLGSGLNLFRVEAFKDGFFLDYGDDLTFNYSLILGMVKKSFRIRFFPISWREDDQVSNVKLVRQTMKVLGILGRYIKSSAVFVKDRTGWVETHGYSSTILLERTADGAISE